MTLQGSFKKNFTVRVVILINCPKGRKVPERSSVGGNYRLVMLVKRR